MPLLEVGELDYFVFLTLRRDAWISKLNATEEGRKYLNNAYRMTLTKPNRSALRKQFQKG